MTTHKIFSPFKIGNNTVDNRIALAPLTRGLEQMKMELQAIIMKFTIAKGQTQE